MHYVDKIDWSKSVDGFVGQEGDLDVDSHSPVLGRMCGRHKIVWSATGMGNIQENVDFILGKRLALAKRGRNGRFHSTTNSNFTSIVNNA